MKKIMILGVFGLCVQFGYSQENSSKPIQDENNMEKSEMLGLRTTIYKVGDIQKATAWYAKAFGVQPYFNEPYYVGFNIGGYELGLQPEDKPISKKVESVVSY